MGERYLRYSLGLASSWVKIGLRVTLGLGHKIVGKTRSHPDIPRLCLLRQQFRTMTEQYDWADPINPTCLANEQLRAITSWGLLLQWKNSRALQTRPYLARISLGILSAPGVPCLPPLSVLSLYSA
jgi:hypothetical protein